MEFEFEDEPKSGDRSDKMAQEQPPTGNLIDTTDCLEAISVIRCWKNLLFIIILLALLLLQGMFWMVNFKLVKPDDATPLLTTNTVPATAEANPSAAGEKIKKAAKQVAADKGVSAEPNQARQAGAEPNLPAAIEFKISLQPQVKHITIIVRFLNFILIPGSMIYCLAMLFSLKVSLIGRLGGINHIARAFFLSLLFTALLLPWQLLFSPVFAGAMFTPAELFTACQAQKNTLAHISFYLRFTIYWLLVVFLLLLAQVRSMRWAKATLRRLEVV